MAMRPPPLNVQPLGLLDAFQIKNGGQYPQELDTRLGVNIDLGQWYAETNAQNYRLTTSPLPATVPYQVSSWTASFPVGLPLSLGFITVPETEVWQVTDYGIEWFFGAAAGSSLVSPPTLCSVVNPAGTFIARPMPTFAYGALASAASGLVGGAAVLTRMTYLQPGEQPGWIMPGFTFAAGANCTFRACIRFRKLRV